MKKILYTLLFISCFGITAHAEECANGAGTVIQANNYPPICYSKQSMNWFSAQAWCKANNYRMISFHDLHLKNNQVPEFQNIIIDANLWLKSSLSPNTAMIWSMWRGLITNTHTKTSRTNQNRAGCWMD